MRETFGLKEPWIIQERDRVSEETHMKLLLLATVVSLALIASSVQAQETKVMPKSMLNS